MPYAFEGGISTEPREDAIPISDADYAFALQAILSGQAVSIVGGFQIVDAPVVVEPDPSDDLDLAQWKALLASDIDARAEIARLRYITGGAGQAMTYQQKAQEAAAVLAAVESGFDPNPDDYPLLKAEIGITAPTLVGVAQIVNVAYRSWLQIGAQIEALRLFAKSAVMAATTIADAKAAAVVAWP
ncbi:hypothetical protein DXT96_07310 [Agrobacterium sp. ICMP 6402]|uniref:hypothetical protein n=1 Tax=Agrobacterium sp. ICMP 6402 TaxID=2292443 RepID=UPI0012967EFE|nr:hypothetical protein [Agrobacterium sp. ICMP 6402]MQB09661.1 hypothetical protein [Agrobacterium sp. ICMP 6402]